ncbi:MAG: hypothetical protein E7E21_05895 [Peptostreptococcaceae bacterium]|nr:hypothetical protein [Peptostreptococcaceae bacterium]
MNNEVKKLEANLPRNCCAFCTHLSFEGPNENYTYDIKCIMLDKEPKPDEYCEYFEPENTKLNTYDLDNLYINFLETCLRVNYTDYLNSIYWKLFKEKVLSEYNYKCSICGSSKNVNVYHLRKNLGRETLNDVMVMCNECLPR